MTLPGGILLALDSGWDNTKVQSFFSENNISTDRVSELEFIPNGFFVETEPGFPSLELANFAGGPGRRCHIQPQLVEGIRGPVKTTPF